MNKNLIFKILLLSAVSVSAFAEFHYRCDLFQSDQLNQPNERAEKSDIYVRPHPTFDAPNVDFYRYGNIDDKSTDVFIPFSRLTESPSRPGFREGAATGGDIINNALSGASTYEFADGFFSGAPTVTAHEIEGSGFLERSSTVWDMNCTLQKD